MKASAALLLGLALAVGTLCAREARPLGEDAAVEHRLEAIAAELRCLVCQNESLAASRADLAMDLKREIRERIRAGQTDDEIRTYLVSRYGDFVLYRPPWKATTVLLWLGPFLLFAAAAVALGRLLRRRGGRRTAPLAPEEAARADALLARRE